MTPEERGGPLEHIGLVRGVNVQQLRKDHRQTGVRRERERETTTELVGQPSHTNNFSSNTFVKQMERYMNISCATYHTKPVKKYLGTETSGNLTL